MQFDQNLPIYLQLLELFKSLILSGNWQPGDQIGSVRDLARDYQVTPNTIQRALSELERDGLCYTERTAGRYVCDNVELINELRNEKVSALTKRFIADMQKVGVETKAIPAVIQKHIDELAE